MDDFDKTTVSLGIIIIIVILGTGILIFLNQEEMDNSCKELGFKEFSKWNNQEVCKDYNGNLHFVDYNGKCFVMKCKLKEISIGDVRIIK